MRSDPVSTRTSRPNGAGAAAVSSAIELVFAQNGDSTLRFRARDDGGLTVSWISPDGKTKMDAQLRRIDPSSLPVRAAGNEPFRTQSQGQ